MEESKHERFIRLATSRTEKILNMIRLLGNCANTSNYEYTSKEVEKIFASIRNELDEQEALFKLNTKKRKRFIL
ncbi:hypothetical protein D081_1978 [Anaerovibrio sp. JC8]|uniref:hypothetical protein n=1 Tax=Anaerovibrio sp. JC8 TaxID=1240085 RepID=UPI000A0CA47F|nr:hypothetical protein [Anaerovibrio sp. JC8]ORT99426.1 hypothetical protein D081_1978 [Anaerovibrio sp. JC8]